MNDTKLITPKELFSLMNKDNPGNIGLMKVYELVRRKDFPALKNADIESTGMHTLRHTFASMLFAKGADVKEVSELLGHANVQITYDTYIHLIPEHKAKVISLLD